MRTQSPPSRTNWETREAVANRPLIAKKPR